MKVAIVHSYYSSKVTSGENLAVDTQAAALRDQGIEVRIIAARTDVEQERSGYLLKSALSVATGHGRSPMPEIEAFAPDVVHVHNLFPNWGTRWLHSWAGALVTSVHNFRPMCAAGTLFRDGATCTLCPDGSSIQAIKHACYKGSRVASIPLAIRNRQGAGGDKLLERSDRVILLSDRSRAIYSRYGLDPNKIDVLPNFIDDVGFAPTTPPGKDWIYIGRLSEEKGILKLVQNWPPRERLNIYGQGPLEEEVIASAGPAVRFHGPLARVDLPGVLSKAKGLVFPSECFEGAPLVYVEAIAAGRTVVAKSGSSAADDVDTSGSGRVFDEWADLAEALDVGSDSLESFGARGRAHFERDFTRTSWAENCLRIYESAISRAGQRRA